MFFYMEVNKSMKRNPKDEYTTSDEDMFIEDAETGERLLFLIDRENRIVIRSLLEEDIKIFVQNFDTTASEKRKKLKLLYNVIPKKESQMYFFAIEKIIGEEEEGKWDSIYGLPRVPIGMGARTDECVTLSKRIGPSIEAYLYTKEEGMSFTVSKMIEKIADYFKIEGTAQIFPVK